MRKRFFGFFIIALFIVGVVLVNQYYLVPTLINQSEASLDSVSDQPIKIKEPSLLYGMVVDNHTVIENKIKRNEVLGDILMEYNVPANIIHQISQLSRKVFDVRKIAANKKYTLICSQDSLKTAKASHKQVCRYLWLASRFSTSSKRRQV
jgi:hypothetical protein